MDRWHTVRLYTRDLENTVLELIGNMRTTSLPRASHRARCPTKFRPLATGRWRLQITIQGDERACIDR
jgi:hypothetical protein